MLATLSRRKTACVFASIASIAAISFAAACSERAPALIVYIVSSLEIPRETNVLVVRIVEGDGRITERTYGLGDPPRDVWPQVLPIVAGDKQQKNVTVAAELRNSQPGAPSVVVGYGEIDTMLPNDGEASVQLDVPRSCVDEDRDGFGSGFGCERPDCDDMRSDIPVPNFCSPPPLPDAGPRDAEADAGAADGGAGDAGDGGTPPIPPCAPGNNGGVCPGNQVCYEGYCRVLCETTFDCRDISFGCLDPPGVCICRVPCQNGTQCGPFACVDGCCRIQ